MRSLPWLLVLISGYLHPKLLPQCKMHEWTTAFPPSNHSCQKRQATIGPTEHRTCAISAHGDNLPHGPIVRRSRHCHAAQHWPCPPILSEPIVPHLGPRGPSLGRFISLGHTSAPTCVATLARASLAWPRWPSSLGRPSPTAVTIAVPLATTPITAQVTVHRGLWYYPCPAASLSAFHVHHFRQNSHQGHLIPLQLLHFVKRSAKIDTKCRMLPQGFHHLCQNQTQRERLPTAPFKGPRSRSCHQPPTRRVNRRDGRLNGHRW